ncbi:hypothetical protein PFICI_03201 [Pestalotiopsis fici W106-1]|uniref:Uncharacterized protein n=1 Tax=Pestalotiopsis fici (strain W106-1 / CGMCC3.15140) TaxID=1229662 RepID=W3XIX6_PESFW|nr:uncharacterized protein PFICI_03201 [Pestalotiopsis fici W106-1]ETS85176.1 hypothetical protein PFICI_03201 [Pestalotiopsis fici W106-1]
MALQSGGSLDPPPYSARAGNPVEEAVDHLILVLEGRSIYPESAANPPLYTLSHEIAGLPESASLVKLERLDRMVRSSPDGAPRTTCRTKHIYNLQHLLPVMSPKFAFSLTAMSRKAFARKVGFRKSARLGQEFKAVTIMSIPGDNLPKGYKALRSSDKELEQIFAVRRRKDTLEWLGLDKLLLAMEDEQDGQQRLLVMSALSREMMDILVACWCLRIWQTSISKRKEGRPWIKSICFHKNLFFARSPSRLATNKSQSIPVYGNPERYYRDTGEDEPV